MADLPLTAFDVAVLLIVGISGLLALVRGATREALTMAAWVGALVVVFVVPLIAFKTVAAVLSDHVSEGGFGMADRLVGMVFGVVRGAAIVCALYLGVGILIEPDQQPSWMTRAALLPYVREGAGMLQDLLPADAEEAGRNAVHEARRDVVRELASP